MHLVEPLALLSGTAAAQAVAAGLAQPLAGGPSAFSLARLHDDGPPRLVRADAIPAAFASCLNRLTAAPRAWAGLPTDRPLVMGIINATPDSFSDGGDRMDAAAAISAGLDMWAAGADIVDVGGESTRPGAAEVEPSVEQIRVLPVVRALAAADVVVSIDTRSALTMAAAVDAGARIVNDVSGLAWDPAAAGLIRALRVPVIIMHMRGSPATMQGLAHYQDVAVEVTRELAARLAVLELAPEQVAVDPGIGFAKGPSHNEALLDRLPLLLNLGHRVVVGASRKGFIGRVALEPAAKARLPGSLAAALAALLGGATILRVHDVAQTVQAVRTWRAIRDALVLL